VYGASEAFVTGTFAGLCPVKEVDGRIIGEGAKGPVVARLQSLYLELIEREIGA
jgi:branched-chain amino acid aminotransferase